jgi:hypothetical protein
MYKGLMPIILDNKDLFILLVKEDIYYLTEVMNNTKNDTIYLKLINSYDLLITNINTTFPNKKTLMYNNSENMHYTSFYILINNWLKIKELIYLNSDVKENSDIIKFIKDKEKEEKIRDNSFNRDNFIYLK